MLMRAALAMLQPDVVVACYGMNDGICYPFGEKRFQAYTDGVNRLIKKVHAAGAKLVLMTPTPFAPFPLRDKGKLKPAGEDKYAYFAMFEDYDEVLTRYAQWIMQRNGHVAMVIDLHTPLSAYVAEQRKQNGNFTLAPDGIHPDDIGHHLMAETILRAWGIESYTEPSPELRKLAGRRMVLLHDAWLTEVGHCRPGVKKGLPIAEANAKADQLLDQIDRLVAKTR